MSRVRTVQPDSPTRLRRTWAGRPSTPSPRLFSQRSGRRQGGVLDCSAAGSRAGAGHAVARCRSGVSPAGLRNRSRPGRARRTAGPARAVERGDLRPVLYPERGVLLPEPVPGWEADAWHGATTMNAAAERYFAELVARRAVARRREGGPRTAAGAQEAGRRGGLRRREVDEAGRRCFSRPRPRRSPLRPTRYRRARARSSPRTRAAAQCGKSSSTRNSGARERRGAVPARAQAAPPRDAGRREAPGLAVRRRLLEEELALVPTLPLEALSTAAPAAGAAGAGGRGGEGRAGSGSTVPRTGAYPCRQERRRERPPHGRIAAPEDYWFHVRDYPGAHVVLKGAGGEPPEEEIRAAASVAAWHSARARNGW